MLGPTAPQKKQYQVSFQSLKTPEPNLTRFTTPYPKPGKSTDRRSIIGSQPMSRSFPLTSPKNKDHDAKNSQPVNGAI
ncbi:hypothetical protein VTN00DRAFT_5534 [Thermoascus crustaceus]|uniref:uncharacterized protein n=1 Tax=Thermoascus crustaceus TaxID=5088 RepID=UPI0037448AEF